ncbi:hypothetical protein [Actinokineospora iranica]|uniref:Uncharacterized protein n=1 Tax=Actinokineospora iranica TaxID=1271860 RepID=A0A1G6Y998_9PSEU|nr:hypothetical protein [Actinokineospora iranica]SDD86968.1 hypothetical protein SAMN05216174_12099 [Actinokineospora iranica]
MLLLRQPVRPSHGQVCLGDYKSDPDTWPEWTDEEFERGVAVSPGMIFIDINDTPEFVVVDIRDGNPEAGETVLFDGMLDVSTLSITGGGTATVQSFLLPDSGEQKVIIVVNDTDRSNIRHVSVYFPHYADPDMPDGAWMNI